MDDKTARNAKTLCGYVDDDDHIAHWGQKKG